MASLDLANVWKKPQSFEGTDHYGLRLINLTTTQRDALTGSGAARVGSIIWNTTTSAVEYYDGSTWSGVPISVSEAELGYIDGVTAGTVTASKAVVVDANKDASSFRDIAVRNLDAGASGTAGTVDVFPSTASKGKLQVAVTDQTGNTTVTVQVAGMGQATQVNLPDPGAAASYVVQSTAAMTLAQADVLASVTPGAIAASKAIVVDSNKDAADARNFSATNLKAGKDAAAGTVTVFPTTAAKGKAVWDVTDQTGNTQVTHRTAAMGQATVITTPDPGAAIASVVLTEGAQILAGVKTFSSGIAFGAGATFDADSAAVSATGDDTTQTATVSKAAGAITTGALTTGAGASTSVVLTLTGVAAGDLVFITKCGGTNTSSWTDFSTIATTNTITVVVRNLNLLAALNGTVKFNYFWMKA